MSFMAYVIDYDFINGVSTELLTEIRSAIDLDECQMIGLAVEDVEDKLYDSFDMDLVERFLSEAEEVVGHIESA